MIDLFVAFISKYFKNGRTEKRLNEPKPTKTMKGDPSWLLLGLKEEGQREVKGKKHNKRILKYHSYTTLNATDDETSWCSSFVNWCMAKSSYHYTRSAMARSWLKYGVELAEPKRGCIVIFARGSKSWQGHVGFYLGQTEKYIILLGGNQSDSVSIKRYSKAKLLGYRWPHGKSNN